jgi:hypothetical protein
MYYSFVVRSERDVPLPEHLLIIGSGLDIFNARVDDLDAFRVKLEAEGVKILEVHQLDGLDPVSPTTLTENLPPLLK